MQIIVDTEKDSPAVLSNVGKFLVLGYGTLAEKTALVGGALPQPAPVVVPKAPDFAPSDSLPPDDFEVGTSKAASVFGAVPVPLPSLGVPVPPPLPSAMPSVQAPAVSASPEVTARDTAGVPYDARIHNKSRTMKQDGTWKLAKGIDPVVVAAVMQELTGSTATVVVPSAPLVPVPPVPPVPSAPVVPVVVTPPVPPVTAPAGAVTFRDVMKKVTENQTAGRLSKAQVDHALAQVGFKPDELAPLVMPANAALLAAFNSLLDATLGTP